jgi:hypothetical protein
MANQQTLHDGDGKFPDSFSAEKRHILLRMLIDTLPAQKGRSDQSIPRQQSCVGITKNHTAETTRPEQSRFRCDGAGVLSGTKE